MTYDLGGVAVLSWTATDDTGAPANAGTACTLTVIEPDGFVNGPYILTGTAGAYSYDFVTRQAGRHTYRFQATGIPGPGVGVGAFTDVFEVYPASPTNLIGLKDSRKLLRIPAGDTTFDDDIRYFAEATTSIIDRFCGPVVPRQITERIRTGGRTMMLRHIPVYRPAGQPHDLVTMTPVLAYGLVYDVAQLSVDADTGEVVHTAGLPFIYGPYDVTYWAGRATVPMNITLANQIILKHLWAVERPSARGGQALGGASDDTTILWGFAIPNRAVELMEPHRTPAGIA